VAGSVHQRDLRVEAESASFSAVISAGAARPVEHVLQWLRPCGQFFSNHEGIYDVGRLIRDVAHGAVWCFPSFAPVGQSVIYIISIAMNAAPWIRLIRKFVPVLQANSRLRFAFFFALFFCALFYAFLFCVLA